jgi:hypothetical protein
MASAKSVKAKANTSTATASYVVLADGRVAGQRVRKGDTIDLAPSVAKYENVSPTTEIKAKG